MNDNDDRGANPHLKGEEAREGVVSMRTRWRRWALIGGILALLLIAAIILT